MGSNSQTKNITAPQRNIKTSTRRPRKIKKSLKKAPIPLDIKLKVKVSKYLPGFNPLP